MRWMILNLGMLLMLSGCSLQPVKTTAHNRYLLNKINKQAYATSPSGLSLLVSRPTANPGFRGAAIVYVNKPYQLQTFSKNTWVAPPAQMLLPLISQSLRNTDYFHAVVSQPFAGLTDRRLDTQLITLQQEFFGKQSMVRMVIQATLIDNRRNKIIASQTLSSTVPSDPSDPYYGVLAANKATANIMQQLAKFVVPTSRAKSYRRQAQTNDAHTNPLPSLKHRLKLASMGIR